MAEHLNHTHDDNECHEEHNCEKIVSEVKNHIPDEDTLYKLAELFKVLGDNTRIKILFCLSEHEMCVNDIAELIGSTQSAVSHQLRILKNSELVKFRREGKMLIYSLADSHVSSIFNQGLEHVLE